MKKIVVTTDLSEDSKSVFPIARKLAESFRCEIDLLAVLEDPSQAAMMYAMDHPIFPDSDIVNQLKAKIEQELSKMLQEHFKDISCSYTIRDGRLPIHREILQYAEEVDADLIIMCLHGRSGFKRLLIGSTAERVVREATRPVLTVPSSRSDG